MKRQSKYASKNKKFEIFGRDMMCPCCKRKIRTSIKKYGVTNENEKSKGTFWFEYQCQNCKAKIINYTDLKQIKS